MESFSKFSTSGCPRIADQTVQSYPRIAELPASPEFLAEDDPPLVTLEKQLLLVGTGWPDDESSVAGSEDLCGEFPEVRISINQPEPIRETPKQVILSGKPNESCQADGSTGEAPVEFASDDLNVDEGRRDHITDGPQNESYSLSDSGRGVQSSCRSPLLSDTVGTAYNQNSPDDHVDEFSSDSEDLYDEPELFESTMRTLGYLSTLTSPEVDDQSIVPTEQEEDITEMNTHLNSV